ncbi:hypothetical protein CHS0354_011569 [Potamilus streckersoni]|uniref:Uncharacterized protein n=1 Tax=Potamilus streckersoni TaxID=2493646 RepID=A0AAE0VHN0_9BIVA|nr:hypothetical protein CHS0354_011569 [Potamilus streckersoni]
MSTRGRHLEYVKRFVCKTPIERSGTIIETVEVELGQNYTYRCQDDLIEKRDQNPTVMCLPGGNWTTTNFTCVCKTPEKSGAINQTEEVEVGQSYTYRCQSDLFEKGDQNPAATCLHDGSWTSTNFICVKQNWTQDTIYPNNIHKSEVISNVTGNNLLACMQECDKEPTKCLSFFYDNHTSLCVLSASFQRGLPDVAAKLKKFVSSVFQKTFTTLAIFGGEFLQCFSEFCADFVKAWVYIGLSDQTMEGRWVNWQGEKVDPYWEPGQPSESYENCAFIIGLGGIHDIRCNVLMTFLCHKTHF